MPRPQSFYNGAFTRTTAVKYKALVHVMKRLSVQDGHTFERSAIAEWLATHNTNPHTKEVLNSKTLQPNDLVRQAVRAHFSRRLRNKRAQIFASSFRR